MKLDELGIFAFTSIHSFFLSEVLGNAVLAAILAVLSFHGVFPDVNTFALMFQGLIVASTVFLAVKAFPFAKQVYLTKAIRTFVLGLAAIYGLAFAVTTLANELHTVVFNFLKL